MLVMELRAPTAARVREKYHRAPPLSTADASFMAAVDGTLRAGGGTDIAFTFENAGSQSIFEVTVKRSPQT